MQKDILIKIAMIISIIALLFIIVPVFHIFFKTSAKELISTIKEHDVWDSILVSLICASFSTISGCILGIPFGYFLSREGFKIKSITEAILNIPIAIPHVAVGIALLSLFNSLHIRLADTIYGIIIAMMFVSFSFIISASITGFEAVENEIEMVSRSLGASHLYTFIHITFPLAIPSILRGAVLSFARSISEVGAILMIAYFPKTAPVLMYERFEEYGLNAARPVCAIVIAVCLIIFFILLSLSKYAKR